ncbi:MAG: hypothetical protein IJX09_01895 [Clostridia bacterium]|nr:hypothetical protein [Clostridia bacterium]
MMKKTKKILTFLLAALCVVGTAGVISACQDGGCSSCNQDESLKISFKDNFPTHLSLNVSVDIAQYVEYKKGTSLKLKAEYTDADGTKKQYETFGTSFMPTQIGDVKLTVSVKDTNIKITKTVPVKIAAPKVISSTTVIRYRGEEFTLDSLKEGLNVLAPNDEYSFKAVQLTMVGSTEKIDLNGLETYTFTEVGTYEVKYEVYNDGGSTEGVLIVFSKRVLTDNEKNDISNYKEGIFGQASGRVVVDEEDAAENSDWSYVIWAPANATGESVEVYAPNYWTNYGMLELEGGIDLSQYYLEFDVKFSADSRNVLAMRMVDEAQTIASNEKVVDRAAANEDGTHDWQHVSMKDMYKYGTYHYIRFMVMHPLTSDASSYDANNVWVKIDNVKLCKYEKPYEYHEPVNYVKTDADYTAEEGAFEEGVQLWENLDDSSRPTYLAQDGAYTDEVTELNFTIDDAEANGYRFVLGARVETVGSYSKGVFVDFRRDAGAAFFAVYAPEGLKQEYYLTAEHCYFESGHNYTVTFGVVGNLLKVIIHDNTANQIVLDYKYELNGDSIPASGGFGIWSYKNMSVAGKKPYTYVEPAEETEVTISGFSIGANNRADYFDLLIANGKMQSAILASGNLTHVEGTFGTTSSWGENQWKFFVGVLASSESSLQIFPTGKTVAAGHKLAVPEGATIIVDGYTVIFGEALEVWYNGTAWQMEEYVVETPDPDPDPEGPTKMMLTALDGRTIYADGMYQLYFKIDIVNSGATWSGWDNNAKVVFNGTETKADGWCFASSGLLYVQLTTDADANPLTIAKGTALKINGIDYEIAEDFNVYYYEGTFQTLEKKEVTISNFSFGSTNKADRVDLVIGDGVLPASFVSYGASNNLSSAEGTLGTAATWNEHKFKGKVGVLTNGNNGFMVFPPPTEVAEGDVITIPQGTTIVANGSTGIFGEEVKLTYNGILWTMEGEEVQTTKMTLSSIASNSVVAGNMYQIYLKTNINNTGDTWANWDNSAKVDLNGTETKADGWCFANNGNNSLLYLQVTTTEELNVTVKKGTILNINGTLYEITEDFHVYYYDGGYHATPKA